MRHAVVLVCLAACAEPKLRAQTLPELVASPNKAAISVARMNYQPNERLRWEVHHKGFTIGRIELLANGGRITSKFRTSPLASMFAKAEHDLVTTVSLAGTYPEAVSERVVVDGERQEYEEYFDGMNMVVGGKARRIEGGVAHTLHTALGVLRTWAQPDAKPGYLMIVHAGELFKLSVDAPMAEDWRGTPTLKVEGRVISLDDAAMKPILLTLWLTANDARTPIRFAVSSDGKQLDAEKIDD